MNIGKRQFQRKRRALIQQRMVPDATSFSENYVSEQSEESLANVCMEIEQINELEVEENSNISLVDNIQLNVNVDDDDDEVVQYHSSYYSPSLKQELAEWYCKGTVSRDNMDSLLNMLKRHGNDVPLHTRTLVNTPRTKISIRSVPPGEYFHFGIENALIRCNYEFLKTDDVIVLDISTDGTPMSESSKMSAWPIFAAFPNKFKISPILVGCYVGNGEPADINDFFKEFVEEALELLSVGVRVTTDKILKILQFRIFVLDSPARSFFTSTKHNTAFSGCHKCDQVGHKIGHRTVFWNHSGNLRTDESFKLRTDPRHHNILESTLIESLEIKMVSQVVLDPMHLVDIGVMKKILVISLKGISKENIVKMSRQLLSLVPFVPTEFGRKPRSFDYVGKYKAVELRQILRYTGAIVFKDFFTENGYYSFMLLHTAIRLLDCSDAQQNVSLAKRLLDQFVVDFSSVYGQQYLSYNVHNLLHLVQCVELHGPLYSFSAYRFENYMQEIKKIVRKGDQILQQIYNRLAEQQHCNLQRRDCGFVGPSIEPFPGCTSSFRGYMFDSFILNNNKRDCVCCISPGVAFLISGFGKKNNENVIIGRRYLFPKAFFTRPVNSKKVLGIVVVKHLSPQTEYYPISAVLFKYFRLPYKHQFVLMPLLHQL